MQRAQAHPYLIVSVVLALTVGFFRGERSGSVAVADADTSAMKLQEAFVRVAERVRQSVVGIVAERSRRLPPNARNRDEDDDPFDPPRQAAGTGIVMSADGLILTSYHVVRNAATIWVMFSDQRRDRERARLLGADAVSDLAALKVERKGLVPIELGDSDTIQVGAWVIAVGNPFRQLFTVTAGIVSAKGRHLEERQGRQVFQSLQDYIQTDAAINPGNSGGPLVDLQGKLIGVNTAIVSQTGANSGIGFAVPVNTVKKILPRLERGEKIARGFLGILYSELTPKEAAAMGVPNESGFQISQVNEKTPAEEAGIKPGDIIIGYGNYKAESSDAFRQFISECPPGTRVPIRILRFADDGPKEMTFIVTLRERDTEEPPLPVEERKSLLGMTVEDLSPQIRRTLTLLTEKDGAVVTQVENGGPADEAGVEVGRFVRRAKLSGAKTFTPIRRARDFENLVAGIKPGTTVVLWLEHPNEPSGHYVSITARAPEADKQ
ncbi:MAG: trypsin-like peptidase domain-containing protein [Abditibacteriales bacterium]|nr:trypsin-like peptidase domain-containing protein [Abditibacteriales bacterium]MDW8368353.1 trypsin-like peptidase domain-containing protein [Abditibacteriales bacterium]